MRKLLNAMSGLGKDEEGVALVEYAVLLGVILAVTVGTFAAIGGSTGTIFTALSTMLASA